PLLPSGPDGVHGSTLTGSWTVMRPSRGAVNPKLRIDWRRGRDSNPRYHFWHTRFPVVHLRPLGHLSRARLVQVPRPARGLGPNLGAWLLGAGVRARGPRDLDQTAQLGGEQGI